MTIQEMNKALKEMKTICPQLKDAETEIVVRSPIIDPCIYDNRIHLETTINDTRVVLDKQLPKGD